MTAVNFLIEQLLPGLRGQTLGSNLTAIDFSGVTTFTLPSGTVAPGVLILPGTITSGGLLTNALQIGTSGPLVYSGSGAPSISAAVKGSIYLRTDGSSTSTRLYVATDTAGTWTNVTTAA